MQEETLTGWLLWSRPPARLLDEIVVTDQDGVTVANRPLPYGTVGTRGWDVTLRDLGFERLGGWMPATDGYLCRIRRTPPPPAAVLARTA
ncbi:hypothetical protein E1212_16975 [Jiangella ureilytica]|uniref:Uncharacterized protein n=1 Tax=Jiangella ureilytica TaxID=2530374 RepID=A0A4R4RMS6_9ACTN|nr:hypothetical protein [Jiangella ureilytica]TDC49823.1 hypothetical protein E1212_16975 [Jiangella ureilytica]